MACTVKVTACLERHSKPQVYTQLWCKVLNSDLFVQKFQLFSLVPLLTDSDILRISIEVQLFFFCFLLTRYICSHKNSLFLLNILLRREADMSIEPRSDWICECSLKPSKEPNVPLTTIVGQIKRSLNHQSWKCKYCEKKVWSPFYCNSKQTCVKVFFNEKKNMRVRQAGGEVI